MERARAGLSLAEMVVAGCLLTCGLLPVVAFSQRGLTEAGSTREEILARQALIDLSERFKGEDPAELTRAASDPRWVEGDSLLKPFTGVAATLGMKRAIAFEKNVDGVTGLHEVVFSVSWNGHRKKPRTMALHRLVHAH